MKKLARHLRERHKQGTKETEEWDQENKERSLDDREQLVRIRAAELGLQQRGEFATKFYWLAIGWLGFVAVTILLDGDPDKSFDLEPEVAIALLATATANVFAPVVVAAKGIFNNARQQDNTA